VANTPGICYCSSSAVLCFDGQTSSFVQFRKRISQGERSGLLWGHSLCPYVLCTDQENGSRFFILVAEYTHNIKWLYLAERMLYFSSCCCNLLLTRWHFKLLVILCFLKTFVYFKAVLSSAFFIVASRFQYHIGFGVGRKFRRGVLHPSSGRNLSRY
jgi:hypothetical protein